MEWYAARTRSNHEAVASLALRAVFSEVFLPTYHHVARRSPSRTVDLERPLFPGYVFLRCHSTYEDWLEAKKAHGVVDLVGYRPGLPEPISDREIEAVRTLVEQGGARCHPYLRTGDRVRVLSGVFKGLEGIFLRKCESKGVLVVSIGLLGQSVCVEIDAHSVDLA